MKWFSLAAAAALGVVFIGSMVMSESSRSDLSAALKRYEEAKAENQKQTNRLAYVCGFTDGRVLGHAEAGKKNLSGAMLDKANGTCEPYRDTELFKMVKDARR